MTKQKQVPELPRCKNCIHWRNQQRLLNYDRFIGFCINPKFKFNTTDGRLIGVVDTNNLRDQRVISGNPSHDFETHGIMSPRVEFSQYLLQTEEDFGCIFYQKDDRD